MFNEEKICTRRIPYRPVRKMSAQLVLLSFSLALDTRYTAVESSSVRDACAPVCHNNIEDVCVTIRAVIAGHVSMHSRFYSVSYSTVPASGSLFLVRVQQRAPHRHPVCRQWFASLARSLWFSTTRRSLPSLDDAATCACRRRSAAKLRFDFRGIPKSIANTPYYQHLRLLKQPALIRVAL